MLGPERMVLREIASHLVYSDRANGSCSPHCRWRSRCFGRSQGIEPERLCEAAGLSLALRSDPAAPLLEAGN
jgi:hypothetical protein